MISWGLNTLFIVTMLSTAWLLYDFPQQLLINYKLIDLEEYNAMMYHYRYVYLAVAATFFTGLFALLFANIGMNKANTGSKTISDQGEDPAEKIIKQNENGDVEIDSLDSVESVEKSEVFKQIQGVFNDKEARKESFGKALAIICKEIEAGQAALYKIKEEKKISSLHLETTYAWHIPEFEAPNYEIGEGLIGQVAKEGKVMFIDSLPEGYISQILSGLGGASPTHLFIAPIKQKEKTLGVVEIASFKKFSQADQSFLENVFSWMSTQFVNNKGSGNNLTTKAAAKSTTEKKSD